MYYYYRRWYDPSIGRFASVDPKPGKLANPQSLNPYTYVTDLPTLLTDPTGEDFWSDLANGFNNYIAKPVIQGGQAFLDWQNQKLQGTVHDLQKLGNLLQQGGQAFLNFESQNLQRQYKQMQRDAKNIHDLSNSPDRLTKGLVNCGVITAIAVGLGVAAVYGGPPVDFAEIGLFLDGLGVTIPTAGLIVGLYPGYNDLLEAGWHSIEDFGGGCASAIVG